jgi:hypothetical protein
MSLFHMTDILPLIGFPEAQNNRRNYNVACPRCDRNREKHLNINLEKDVFRCARCGFSGGIFDLYAHCMNIPRELVKDELERRIGTGDYERPKPKQIPEPIRESEAAPVAVRDTVYRAFLSKLTLAADHAQNLQNRGLTEAVIDRLGYRTTPVFGAKALAKQLLTDGFHLSGVPGFYRDDAGQWTFISEQRGILIPVRDVQGRIQGLQIRRDNVQKRKFRWVSSTGRQDGCRSEGWTHFAGTIREKIILIEGPLKADVVFNLTGQSVLAVPGVNALLQLEQTLSRLRESGVRRIATAFDMDFLRNWYVQNGYAELIGLLCKMGFQYNTMLWNPDYNGLDDYVWECCLNRGSPDG